jgi:hypothetical protein
MNQTASWRPNVGRQAERQTEHDSPGSVLRPLAGRVGIGLLLLIVGRLSFESLPYYPSVWAQFLPLLFFLCTVLSLRFGILLAVLSLSPAILYAAPGMFLGYLAFLLFVGAIHYDSLEHFALVTSTPILLLSAPGLGFLPLLLGGLLLRDQRWLASGLGCLAAIGIAAALGWQTFAGIVLTGLEMGQPSLVALPHPVGSVLDFSWLGGLSLEALAIDSSNVASRWLETIFDSPVALAQVLLWSIAGLCVQWSCDFAGRSLHQVGLLAGVSSPIAYVMGALLGDLAIGFGYSLLVMPFQGAVVQTEFMAALLKQLGWSTLVALVVVLIRNTVGSLDGLSRRIIQGMRYRQGSSPIGSPQRGPVEGGPSEDD